MSAYTPLGPTGLDTNLVPKEVRAKYFSEFIYKNPFRDFMDTTDTAAIQTVEKNLGMGDTYTFPFSKEIDYKNPIKGNFEQVEGKGENSVFQSDTVTVNRQAFSVKEFSLRYMDIETPVKVFNSLKPKLLTAHERNFTFDILKAATTEAYPSLATGPIASRVVYGAKAYNATIQGGIDSMVTGSAYNQDGCSVKGILKLHDMALRGGATYESDRRVNPLQVGHLHGSYTPTWAYFMDTISYRSLMLDPLWSNFQYRGVIESWENQPSGLTGTLYRGQIGGVKVYEIPELGNFYQTSTDTTQTVAWNMLVGAQAWGVVWGAHPWFNLKYVNMDLDAMMMLAEIRGQKLLKIPAPSDATKQMEVGLIHHFVNITGL